jgi:uncharacterized phage protein (TIGR02218 family)
VVPVPDAAVQGLTIGGVACYATCWEITRADAVVYRFTDHNTSLVFDGNTYTPTGGFRASAREREEGLSPQNLQLTGPLQVAAITDDDLRAGRFRRASIREVIVDWRYPWAGTIRDTRYLIREVKFNGESWDFQLEGMLGRMQVRVGYNYERRCRWQRLGDSNCGASLAGKMQTGRAVTTVSDDRRVFNSTISTGNGDGYFDEGEIEFTSGDNIGVIRDVKEYVEVNGVITLQIDTPFAIQTGDEFTIKPGCDRRATTCKTRFNNFNRFGGFPFIPGNDHFLTTPDAQQQ